MAVSKDEFRLALRNFASGITVVTTTSAGQQFGITVSAFTSVSLEPPLILVCIDKRASIHDHLAEGAAFAVNILAADQQDLSQRFASKVEDRFANVATTTDANGSPLLDGALAHLQCRVVQAYAGGDHTICVGEVEATSVKQGKPLAYFDGQYAYLA